LQEVIAVMGAASFSKMLHSVPLAGTNQSTAIFGSGLSVHKYSLAAPDRPLHCAAEPLTDIRTQAMALHQVFGVEIERSGNIHYRKIRVGAGNQTALVGDPESASWPACDE
jgi:hypothetical protein